eukprot:gene13649-3988_t
MPVHTICTPCAHGYPCRTLRTLCIRLCIRALCCTPLCAVYIPGHPWCAFMHALFVDRTGIVYRVFAQGLDYCFAQFTGIFIAALVYFFGSSFFKNNNVRKLNGETACPAVLSGALWGVGQASWEYANPNLGFATTYPFILSITPLMNSAFLVV